MGIYRHPPPPFIGGRGPLLPRRLPPSELAVPVNDPIPSSGLRRAALLAIVVGAWQPSLEGLPQQRRHFVPPPVAAADNPPFTSRVTLPTILAAWEPLPPAPQTAKKSAPALLVVPEDPPFTSRSSLPAILDAWQPGPPAPQVAKKLPPSILAVAVDDPPFTSRTSLPSILEAWQPVVRLAAPRRFVPEGVAVDDPPVGRRLWLSTILESWQPGAPQRHARTFLIPPTAVVDDPPRDPRRWLPTILESWQPPPPLPWMGWKVNPAIEAVAVDDPPVGPRLWLSIVLEAWQPEVPAHIRRRFTPEVVVVVGDDPPFGQRRKITILETIFGTWRPPVQPFMAAPVVIAPRSIHRIPVMHCFPWQLQILAQQTTPPGAPATGERYVVTSVATGIWAGHETTIAWFDGVDWQFDVPTEGWATYNLGTSTMLFFDGAAWITWTIP